MTTTRASLFSRGKPISIGKSGSRWTVHVQGEPVVQIPGSGITYRGRPGFTEDLSIAKFKTKGDARFVAHKIGAYVLKLGDFAYTYVEGW